MPDIATLVAINLYFQVALAVPILWAAVLARKRQLDKHCRIMRFAIFGQILSIAIVMLPQLIGLVDILPVSTSNGVFMWVHHVSGLLVVGLWIFVNLAVTGKITVKGRLLGPMRLALISWVVALGMGIYMYRLLWPWPWA
jgi:hypothetical protein